MKTIQDLGLPMYGEATLNTWLATLKDGDQLFVQGKNWYDFGIEAAEHFPLTHVATLFKHQLSGMWLLLEAQLGINVRITSLDYYILRRKFPCVVARHRNLSVNDSRMVDMFRYGFGFLGFTYDTDELLRILGHEILPLEKLVHPEYGETICSELVASCLKYAGLSLDPQPGGNTPATLFNDPNMQHLSAYLPE